MRPREVAREVDSKIFNGGARREGNTVHFVGWVSMGTRTANVHDEALVKIKRGVP
jgi:hypothetical protein